MSVLVLIAALIVFKRYRNKASNYSVKKRESCISGGASNPLQDTSGEIEMVSAAVKRAVIMNDFSLFRIRNERSQLF